MSPHSRERFVTTLAFFFATTLAAVFFFKIPTLDFDEALYRSVVSSMKHTNNAWLLAWDTKSLFHKPPIFYWLIWFFSILFDGVSGPVSTLACRMPSLLATLGILVCLYQAGRRFLDDEEAEIGKKAVLAFLCGLFPLLTATSVLLDPLQTFLLMPALIVPTLLFFDETKLKSSDWGFWCLSLFAATAEKGLNGIIVPTFAFGLQTIFYARIYGLKNACDLTLRFLIRVFIPALVLIALYFFWLNEKIGPAFTHEFLWVQHFERSTEPMEAHSGNFLYQLFVIFFGGGILIPLLIERLGRIQLIFEKFGFPITYALSFVIVFGISATKLPHYSWPAWPAIALFVGLIPSSLQNLKRATELRRIAMIPILLVGIFSASLAFAPRPLLGLMAKTPSFLGVMKYFSGFSFFECLCFFIAAVLCFGFIFQAKKILPRLEVCAAMSVGIALCLSLGFANTLQALMVTPFYEISESIKHDGATPSDCIRYSGALSPTLSLALAPEFLHNRCEPEVMRYLIAPEWKSKECAERNFKVIDQKSYLVLCKKN